MRWFAILVVALLVQLPASAAVNDKPADAKPKRLLLVTHSGGFMHDSIALAEKVLKDIGPKYGFEVTCWRFTNDPNPKGKTHDTVLGDYSENFRKTTGDKHGVHGDQCGRINADSLKNFDAVLFFTTGNPVTKEELRDLIQWVEKGGAFAGTHCASDTLYGTAYGKLVGAYFNGHPWHQKVKLHVEDPHHPAAKGFKDGAEITDEIYQFNDSPYSRDHLHIILSIDNSSVDVSKGARKDKDYAVSWCQEVGKGRSFYTSLGHRKEVWQNPRFQQHLMHGLRWAVGLEKGNATPSSRLKTTR
jgi:type 1 glutamine amidotransferase